METEIIGPDMVVDPAPHDMLIPMPSTTARKFFTVASGF
jgi:hypothetical protein